MGNMEEDCNLKGNGWMVHQKHPLLCKGTMIAKCIHRIIEGRGSWWKVVMKRYTKPMSVEDEIGS
jgi:hypothetical protein